MTLVCTGGLVIQLEPTIKLKQLLDSGNPKYTSCVADVAFIMLINVKVDILTFMSRIQVHAHLSRELKKFYNLGAWFRITWLAICPRPCCRSYYRLVIQLPVHICIHRNNLRAHFVIKYLLRQFLICCTSFAKYTVLLIILYVYNIAFQG